jgi:SAM-dependent methyltransferase
MIMSDVDNTPHVLQPLPSTGERCIPVFNTPWAVEHLHRYAVAQEACRGKRVLDIASGEGYGSALLASVALEVTGVDVSEEAVSHARHTYPRENLRFILGRAESVPMPDDSVDVVVSFETLEHLDDHDAMLGELKRVLRPDGLLIISTPDRSNYPDSRIVEGEPEANPFHIRELNVQEFKTLVARHFAHSKFLGQRLVSGSLLVPHDEVPGFRSYSGDFVRVTADSGLAGPIYHFCYASNEPLTPVVASIFDGWEPLINLPRRQLDQFKNSSSYRLSRILTLPFRRLMRLIRAK